MLRLWGSGLLASGISRGRLWFVLSHVAGYNLSWIYCRMLESFVCKTREEAVFFNTTQLLHPVARVVNWRNHSLEGVTSKPSLPFKSEDSLLRSRRSMAYTHTGLLRYPLRHEVHLQTYINDVYPQSIGTYF